MAITMEFEHKGVRSGDDGYDGNWEHTLWEIELVNHIERDGEYPARTTSFVLEYRTGMAHDAPELEDVLESLLMDAQGIRFEDMDSWIESYGLEIKSMADARKAEATYNATVQQTVDLAEFLGEAVLNQYLDMDSDKAAKELIGS